MSLCLEEPNTDNYLDSLGYREIFRGARATVPHSSMEDEYKGEEGRTPARYGTHQYRRTLASKLDRAINMS